MLHDFWWRAQFSKMFTLRPKGPKIKIRFLLTKFVNKPWSWLLNLLLVYIAYFFTNFNMVWGCTPDFGVYIIVKKESYGGAQGMRYARAIRKYPILFIFPICNTFLPVLARKKSQFHNKTFFDILSIEMKWT